MVRPDVLGVPGDAIGGRHRRDRRHVQHLVGRASGRCSARSSTATASNRRWCSPTTAHRACFTVATLVYLTVASRRAAAAAQPAVLGVGRGRHCSGRSPDRCARIALSTCVTLLVPAADRDRANGMVGTVSGRLVRHHVGLQRAGDRPLGMGWAYLGALTLTGRRARAPATIRSRSRRPARGRRPGRSPPIDIRGALEAIHAVPGLTMLILLAAFNNLLGGVFMALMDAYGLRLVSVEAWGTPVGCDQLAFIAGGLAVASVGLGSEPGAGRAGRQPRQLDRVRACSRSARRSCCWRSG